METIRNYINGMFVEARTGGYLDNISPREGRVYSRLPDSDAADVEAAVAAALAALPMWKAKTAQERAACLLKLADKLEERREEFALAESRDQGKPLELARSLDIPRAIENFRFFAGAVLHEENAAFTSSPTLFNYTLRQPVGVAGLISPWNLPLYLLTWKIAPALVTGNTVVAKPSELTPMTAFLLAQLFEDAGLPPGVCNIVFGRGNAAGDALVGHPEVPLISFTGGTATAARISSRAAPFYKKLSFELGGKNPALIFADCEFEGAVQTSIRSSFLNQGEICLCTSRLLIEEGIFARFAEAFVTAVEGLQVGDPLAPGTFMGALVSAEHLRKVEGFVERALRDGAKLLTGGKRLDLGGELAQGYFYAPTVLLVEDPESEIFLEEVFGPLVTLTRFQNEADAIRLAHKTRYGLAATLWTRDLSRAHRLARDLEVGQVWVNTWMKRDLRVPFGGMKASGIGREGGRYSLEFYTEEKNICVQL